MRGAAKRRVVPRQQAARPLGQRLTSSPGTPATAQTATAKGGSSLRRIVKNKHRANADSAASQEPSSCQFRAIA